MGYESPTAGFQPCEDDRIFARLRGGILLHLLRKVDNALNKCTVLVYENTRKLGFVSGAENAAVSKTMDRSEKLSARILRLQESNNHWDRVRSEVTLDG